MGPGKERRRRILFVPFRRAPRGRCQHEHERAAGRGKSPASPPASREPTAAGRQRGGVRAFEPRHAFLPAPAIFLPFSRRRLAPLCTPLKTSNLSGSRAQESLQPGRAGSGRVRLAVGFVHVHVRIRVGAKAEMEHRSRPATPSPTPCLPRCSPVPLKLSQRKRTSSVVGGGWRGRDLNPRRGSRCCSPPRRSARLAARRIDGARAA